MQEDGSEPTSPFEESSSANSSPYKSGPFTPLYSITVTDAVKNGEALQFTIQVVEAANDDKVKVCLRQYDDIEWLYHCLITQNDISGLIVPPLPPRPEVDAKAAESKSKKQLGSDTKVIVPDEFNKDCRNIEKYLRLVVNHEILGKDKTLHQFLCESEAPVGTKVKRGFMSRLSSKVEEARKGQHKDIDEYFHKQREWATEYTRLMKETSDNFHKLVYCRNELFGYLAESLENAKEMLFRRTCLLVEYEDSNRNLDKAKPNKQQAAEEAKKKAEKAYEDCTENARRELKSFLQQSKFNMVILYGNV
ncbi:hypothetical protein KUTeg_024571 [Tegillarca granosa]|uniref:PX domain-containing protein n=1 Tax=Tegillarca granosa TaxID=220873 RepID=A0ABQ9DYR2_TEGGR|nr:hypothetical protein KUTeg_024571 [Tegillarca granosa]